MTITNDAKNRIRDLIVADISSVALGTDGTDTSASDTDLGAVVEATRKTPTITIGNKTINISHTLNSAEGNGNTYKEAGVFINTDGILLDRVVFPDYNKTSTNELTTVDIIIID